MNIFGGEGGWGKISYSPGRWIV